MIDTDKYDKVKITGIDLDYWGHFDEMFQGPWKYVREDLEGDGNYPRADFRAYIVAGQDRIAMMLTHTYYDAQLMAKIGIHINLFLAALNLIPLPPLDGSRCVSALLPPKIAYHYDKIEPYGLWILVFLLFSGLLSHIITPAYLFLKELIFALL